jgi:predicted transposase/invertase (TIGR01784 family)
MQPLLNPKLDIIFKQLFTTDLEILLNLVNAVLQFPSDKRIQSVEVKNPTILPEMVNEKYIILDIRAVDNHQHQYDIEMQVQEYQYYPERTVYYLSRLYAGQLEAGEQYFQLKPVIGIHFLDDELFSKHPEYHFCFELRDVRYPNLRLTDQFALHMFELPKFERCTRPEQWGGDEAMRIQYKNPAVHKAFSVLERLSSDEEACYLAQMREDALRNEATQLAAAKEEGREEGRLIGAICTLQEVLKQPVSPEEDLAQKGIEELREMLRILKAKIQ